MYLISTVTLLVCIGAAQECLQRNTSCSDIKAVDGFKFSHEYLGGSEIFVYYNKTTIAHANLGSQSFKFSNEVKSIDNDSVITRHCRDLRVTYIVPDGEPFVKEKCVYYEVTEKMKNEKNEDPSDLPTTIVWILAAVILVVCLLGIWCISRKTEVISSRYRLICARLRKWISQAEMGETEETRLNKTPSVPNGVGENDSEQDTPLESVHVHSNDPKDDGKTPHSLSVDSNLSNDEIQTFKNGDISAPDVNKASDYRAMHSQQRLLYMAAFNTRNRRDDPGGVNNNNDVVMKSSNGWTLEDCGPEDQENEGQTLLPSQRAAIREIDMTGEAAALVYKLGFDPDQVSGCSTAQDTDVESTANIKN